MLEKLVKAKGVQIGQNPIGEFSVAPFGTLVDMHENLQEAICEAWLAYLSTI